MGLSQEAFLEHLQEKGRVQLTTLKIPIRGLPFLKKIKRISTNLSKYDPFYCLNFTTILSMPSFTSLYHEIFNDCRVSYCITKMGIMVVSWYKFQKFCLMCDLLTRVGKIRRNNSIESDLIRLLMRLPFFICRIKPHLGNKD